MSSRMEESTAEPQTVGEAKAAVERSRERISSTLDALEDRIVDRKHAMQERMDVLRPVRDQVVQRPFTAVAFAIGVGALLGSLGGSDVSEREPRDSHVRSSRSGRALSEHDRAELREWRRMRRDRLHARARHGHEHDDGASRLTALKHQLAGAVTSAIGAAVTARLKEFTDGSGQRGDGRGY